MALPNLSVVAEADRTVVVKAAALVTMSDEEPGSSQWRGEEARTYMTGSGPGGQDSEGDPGSGGVWQADLRDELLERYGEREGESLYAEVGDAFPLSYRVLCEPARAATDVERLRALDHGELLASGFVDDAGGTRFVVSSREPISLSAVLPVLRATRCAGGRRAGLRAAAS